VTQSAKNDDYKIHSRNLSGKEFPNTETSLHTLVCNIIVNIATQTNDK